MKGFEKFLRVFHWWSMFHRRTVFFIGKCFIGEKYELIAVAHQSLLWVTTSFSPCPGCSRHNPLLQTKAPSPLSQYVSSSHYRECASQASLPPQQAHQSLFHPRRSHHSMYNCRQVRTKRIATSNSSASSLPRIRHACLLPLSPSIVVQEALVQCLYPPHHSQPVPATPRCFRVIEVLRLYLAHLRGCACHSR